MERVDQNLVFNNRIQYIMI